ncbi:MAG TPA: YidC/Oxa1 family membrane protein insertase [Solirubrobacteraceae bacterium]|nr:YidC/Oxa1 family membrane protein insertase [Solirubrobacteraceae bacterium]
MLLLTANIFQPLIDVFQQVLLFFHNHVGLSWGLSIIALTVLMRAILLPLTVKQFHSMQRMQRMQPQLKALQAKYKDDKQRQQQELMKFYKENQINPLGSCLPLVAQLPVFISLFYMLREDLRKNICPQTQAAYQAKYAAAHHISLSAAAGHTTPCGPNNGAGFLFIPDLTNKATGIVLIVLLILYVGSQLFSSLLMSSPMMDQTQRRMMMLLPLFFVVIVINFPAGLLVYWITTNFWTMGQQYAVRRLVGQPATPPVDESPPGGSGGGGGPPDSGPNGSGSGSGLSGLLRRREKEPEKVGVAAGSRGERAAAPPPPPRKKKKRSGRRR